MSMVKRNVVEQDRTPRHELERSDVDWDKQAAAEFKPKPKKENPK